MIAIKENIRVFAPATCANVACGFDIFGFALTNPGDEVEVSTQSEKGVVIREITGDDGKLPLDPEKNAVGYVAKLFLEKIDAEHGVEIVLHKKMPIGSGLGSSSASCVASAVAMNELFGNPLTKDDLLKLTLEGEKLCCGSAHADNVAPALFGGFVLVRSYKPLDIIKVQTPDNLYCAIVHPHTELRTEESRNALPENVPLATLIKQTGNVAGLITGLTQNDHKLISRSLEDIIVEPARSPLIPNFAEMKKAALNNGALGASISGAGPSVFALCSDEETANTVAKAMQQALQIESSTYVSPISPTGAHVIS